MEILVARDISTMALLKIQSANDYLNEILCCTYLNWKYINVKANKPLCRENGVRYTQSIYVLKQIRHLGSVMIK